MPPVPPVRYRRIALVPRGPAHLVELFPPDPGAKGASRMPSPTTLCEQWVPNFWKARPVGPHRALCRACGIKRKAAQKQRDKLRRDPLARGLKNLARG